MPIPLGVLAVAGAGAAPSGPGAYEWLETVTLGTATSSVTFSNLNSTYGSTYKHLQIRVVGRSTETAANDFDNLAIKFNSDSTSSTRFHRLEGASGSVTSSTGTGTSGLFIQGVIPRNNAGFTNIFGAAIIDILDFANTNKNKTVRTLSGHHLDIVLDSGLYVSTSAIDSIQLQEWTGSSNFVANSRFSLYGIRSVNP